DVVQVDVRKHWADWTALRHPIRHLGDYSVLHHAGFQPFVQEPQQSPIADPMLYELAKPRPIDRVEIARQIRLYDVAHTVQPHSVTQTMQCRVRAALRAEPVRALQKILLEHCAEYPRHRLLDHAIFDRADSYRAAFSIGLGNVDASDHRRLIAPALQSRIQIPQLLVEVHCVVLVALSIYARRRLLAQGAERQT